MFRYFAFALLSCIFLFGGNTQEGLNYLNTLRKASGLIALKPSDILNKAAQSHATYLIQNQQNSHYEKKGKYSYTGKTPSQRINKAGYPSTVVMENLSINAANQKRAIDNLFAAIYHRFTFLNLYVDTMGMGIHRTKKKRAIKQAYVYNLASSELMQLCLKPFAMKSGKYYMKEVCADVKKMVPQDIFNEKENKIRQKNKRIILYPYAGQKQVPTAFYNESPDPLPNYKVSGFPISVQFNTAFVKHVKLKSFRLYDSKSNEIKKTKILQAKNDPNHLFSNYDFALMPLARLEFNTKYTAIFEAIVEGEEVKKTWSFTTQNFKEKLYRLNQNVSTITAKVGSTIILYMVPNHRRDLLRGYRAKGNIKANFIDQNTLRVNLPKHKSSAKVSMTFSNKKKVYFIVE